MKGNTWIVVAVALALTATMVVAKSFITTPDQVAAEPPNAISVIDQLAMQTPASEFVDQAPTISEPLAEETPEQGWSVLVVRGNKIEEVTYADPQVKSDVP